MDLPTVQGGRGPRFLRHTGTGAVLESAQVSSAISGLLSSTPELLDGASLLLVAVDFDAGDDPASVVGALVSHGIRAVIAPGFERRFYERGFADGLLPAIVAADPIERLVAQVTEHPQTPLTVDLEEQRIECDRVGSIPFQVDPRGRNKLLLGLSDLDEIARHSAKTAELRAADRARRPWLYGRT